MLKLVSSYLLYGGRLLEGDTKMAMVEYRMVCRVELYSF